MEVTRIVELPRIEGHLDVEIEISGEDVRVRAMAREGIRIYDRILRGREYSEVPDIVSRMCGVCSVIHRVTSVMAIESALGIIPSDDILALRELATIGGHVQSHLIHLFYFILPDILGIDSFIRLIDKNPGLIKKVMRIKGLANSIIEALSGRAVHPITTVNTETSFLPSRDKVHRILDELKATKNITLDLSKIFLEAEFPDIPKEENFVSLASRDSINLLTGKISTTSGVMEPQAFLERINAIIEEYSTAPHFLFDGKAYMVGSLSRLNNNYPLLNGSARDLAKEFNLTFPSNSIFMNNKAQALEIVYFLERAEEILGRLLEKDELKLQSEKKHGNNFGLAATEAPRGLLIHTYQLENGKIISANIITPTAQNLKNIEKNASEYVRALLNNNFDLGEIRKQIEFLVRSYDPCISCAARFRKSNNLGKKLYK
ncbi:MAG: Ni/Fe hydrogenase subunit alpha [Crenarchaeota archaeon]|nr:Ni/Fe hydrogenase subunit alpha [Thermoproteota archaeon]